ncbi:MAG: tetratricopeptide repeat protein [Chloroflexi bacterium]|nr:tetratricopeptide repeat protein [Chloroflexota bacterium]GIW11597.1 MAG: hypothetical protein KatS3mg061_2654 [Dehalococcoidia bacterium]
MAWLNHPGRRLGLLGGVVLLLSLAWASESFGWLLARQPVLREEPTLALQTARLDSAIGARQEHLRRNPNDALVLSELGALYLTKARLTLDPSWYDRAERVLDQALRQRPEFAPALTARGELALARHRFDEARTIGEQAVRLAPYSIGGYAVLADALIELGAYAEAVPVVQQMVDLKPTLASYARVSYLRELHGDLPGAIAAMELAVEAGAAGTEPRSWALAQLGHLHFLSGDLARAAAVYRRAEAETPGYHAARAGLARLAAAEGRYAEASALLEPVTLQTPLPEYLILLGDIYAAAGRSEEAQQQYRLVRAVSALFQSSGVDVDLELALFDLDQNENVAAAYETLSRLASVRPSIKVLDALAWALYRLGEPETGLEYARQALRLGTPDPLLLYHAGKLAAAAGRPEEARGYFARALALNPRFSLRWATDLHRSYQEVGGTLPESAR